MEIIPEKLEFFAPFVKHTSNTLELRNPTNEYIAFKVKTTAPKLFCVRPNASIVGPNESVSVSITHQALPQEPGPDYVSKDKFLILSAPLNDAAAQSGQSLESFIDATRDHIAEFWTQAERTKSVPIASKKMKVQVRPFGAGAGSMATSRADQTIGEESFANYEAAAQSPAPQSAPSSSGAETRATEAVSRSAAAPRAAAVPRREPSSTSEPALDEKAVLGQAQQDIKSLKKDIGATSEKPAATSKPSQTSQAVAPQQGVPVSVVALVALLALLVGWFLL